MLLIINERINFYFDTQMLIVIAFLVVRVEKVIMHAEGIFRMLALGIVFVLLSNVATCAKH